MLKDKDYEFCNYKNHEERNKAVILRHDIDFSLEDALEMAKIERNSNVKSTYFVLLSTSFYNIFSIKASRILHEISSLGHEIGLHFDETKYSIDDKETLEFFIDKESNILSQAIGRDVETVSMHRPSKWLLDSDIRFKNIINTYSNCFFKEFKYLSDSRMFWREDVFNIIKKESYDKLHILTHPFWYSNQSESMKNKIYNFVSESKTERYKLIEQNFRDLKEVLTIDEIDR